MVNATLGVFQVQFSVIVATRNRPALLRRAIASILRQSSACLEIVVVDDGSSAEFSGDYDAISADMAEQGRIYHLPPTPGGSGPSRARNFGLNHCRGEFVAFLDDDDEWTDPAYLSTVDKALAESPDCDLHLMNQRAVAADGTQIQQPIWIEDLAAALPPGPCAWRLIAPSELLRSNGFCHLNTTVVRRRLLQDELGGFDEAIRYEEDRDFYLRAVEAARAIIYNPAFVAQHHVPDPKQRSSASNTLTADQRAEFRIRVLDNAIARTRQKPIRDYCRRLKGYIFKVMATREAGLRNYDVSYRYAREGLQAHFSYKWLGYVGWIWLRRLLRASR